MGPMRAGRHAPYAVCVLAASLLAGGGAPRAEAQAQGTGQPTFRTGVDIVRVDVSVTGRDDEIRKVAAGTQP